MATAAELQPPTSNINKPMPSVCADWTLYEYPVVTSTNLVAANLPVWNAVRADTQTNGRGRFQRTWISDVGGLWLSAVAPLARDAVARRALPLAAGLAISNALSELGVIGLRLRWPNDVLADDRKLAGLLIDQFTPGVAVIGVGINVTNRPETKDPQLATRATRLADLLPTPPALSALTALVLRHLRQVLTGLKEEGAAPLFVRVNDLWGPSRAVELDLDGTISTGVFEGVDPEGRLTLLDQAGKLIFYDAHEVRHLTET